MANRIIGFNENRPGAGLPDVVEEKMGASTADPSTTLGRHVQQAHLAPSLTPIYARHEPLRKVEIQTADPKVAYAARFDGSPGRPFDKTTDGGQTWTQRGSLPFAIVGAVRLASGTIIAVEDTNRTVAGDARIARSTDDGATWSVITGALRFPPLSEQGICEGTDGSIGIAEYGNVGSTVYRLRRSTDDGLTWTTVLESSGTEPQYDPGHFHSLTYDPIEKCHVAFLDRPDHSGFDGPQVWVSRDDMATWTLLGASVDWDHPNFVAPMYFENYIAWGSDNQINGRISRMKREHFYSGNWEGNTEHVFQSNQQAMYWSMPVRDDVWLVLTNVEHIQGAQDGRMGYAASVLVVDQDGARVSGGIDYAPMTATFAVGQHVPARFRAPSLPMGHTESQGWAWLAAPGSGTIPVTQGWTPPTTTPDMTRDPVLHQGVKVLARNASGEDSEVVRSYEGMLEATVKELTLNQAGSVEITKSDGSTGRVARALDNYLALTPGDGGVNGAQVRINSTNQGSPVEFRAGGKVVAQLDSALDRFAFRQPIALGGTSTVYASLGIFFGSAIPEGTQEARPGSIYLCFNYNEPENAGLWVKEGTGAGSSGWVKK